MFIVTQIFTSFRIPKAFPGFVVKNADLDNSSDSDDEHPPSPPPLLRPMGMSITNARESPLEVNNAHDESMSPDLR